jgi:hypothetical protein
MNHEYLGSQACASADNDAIMLEERR